MSLFFGLRSRRILLASGIAMLLAAAAPIACFSLQEPACAFTCVTPPHLCPENYSCGDDGLCHRAGATGVCAFAAPNDGAADAADAAADAGAADAGD